MPSFAGFGPFAKLLTTCPSTFQRRPVRGRRHDGAALVVRIEDRGRGQQQRVRDRHRAIGNVIGRDGAMTLLAE